MTFVLVLTLLSGQYINDNGIALAVVAGWASHDAGSAAAAAAVEQAKEKHQGDWGALACVKITLPLASGVV
jgi:hypothetical protein